jgi:hypothetical protein
MLVLPWTFVDIAGMAAAAPPDYLGSLLIYCDGRADPHTC